MFCEGAWDDEVADRFDTCFGVLPARGRDEWTGRDRATRQPWLLLRDAKAVLVLHRYDMPLIGVIRQDGDLYLCRCIEGQTEG